MRIFVDLDGVLGDFNRRFLEKFRRPCERMRKEMGKEALWEHVQNKDPKFFRDLNLMPDARELVTGIEDLIFPFDPIILTGSPTVWAYTQKMDWAEENFPGINIIVCRSKDKHFFCSPEDILIDDRTKYKNEWEAAGGTFITHLTATQSLDELKLILE